MPVPKVLDIYKWFTPHIALVAPDIKLVDYRTYEEFAPLMPGKIIPFHAGNARPFICLSGDCQIQPHRFSTAWAASKALSPKTVRSNPIPKLGWITIRCIASVIPLLLKYQGTGKNSRRDSGRIYYSAMAHLDGYLGGYNSGLRAALPPEKTGGTCWAN